MGPHRAAPYIFGLGIRKWSGELGQTRIPTDKGMDRCYQVHYLLATQCCTVNNNSAINALWRG